PCRGARAEARSSHLAARKAGGEDLVGSAGNRRRADRPPIEFLHPRRPLPPRRPAGHPHRAPAPGEPAPARAVRAADPRRLRRPDRRARRPARQGRKDRPRRAPRPGDVRSAEGCPAPGGGAGRGVGRRLSAKIGMMLQKPTPLTKSWLALALPVCALLAAGCRPEPPKVEPLPAQSNILLITVDTLRA